MAEGEADDEVESEEDESEEDESEEEVNLAAPRRRPNSVGRAGSVQRVGEVIAGSCIPRDGTVARQIPIVRQEGSPYLLMARALRPRSSQLSLPGMPAIDMRRGALMPGSSRQQSNMSRGHRISRRHCRKSKVRRQSG